MKERTKKILLEQLFPVVFAAVIFVVLAFLYYLEIKFLNRFSTTDIMTQIRFKDVVIGLTIYLKTSVDFAILMGNLMAAQPGWKNRVIIESGTAAGNALGTMIILAIWNFFRNIEILLGLMVFIASLVLLRLAEDGLDHTLERKNEISPSLVKGASTLEKIIKPVNRFTNRFLRYIIPHMSLRPKAKLTMWGLLSASFTIPFILGLDDFAGYVPLFNIINVFGFGIGVFLGHMILNIFLFLSPTRTVRAIKYPPISFLGSIAFIALAVWGLYESYKIFFGLH